MSSFSRFALSLAVCASLTGPAGAGTDEDALPADVQMTGTDIYRRVTKNRFHSVHQEMQLRSGDRSKREDEARMLMTWANWRDAQDKAVDGFFSKTIVVCSDPFDLRNSSYLVLQRDTPPNDQFMYARSRRNVRRLNLRAETILGTDFSSEDIVPRELEKATYVRQPDDEWRGAARFVVEAKPNPDEESAYSRFVMYIEKEHFVPLRTLYWDKSGVQVKELVCEPESLKEFEGVYLPMTSTMRNLQQDTYTILTIEKVEPNPKLHEHTFDPHRLGKETKK
jgi:Outer membrane lipoprotein-sorting protein